MDASGLASTRGGACDLTGYRKESLYCFCSVGLFTTVDSIAFRPTHHSQVSTCETFMSNPLYPQHLIFVPITMPSKIIGIIDKFSKYSAPVKIL